MPKSRIRKRDDYTLPPEQPTKQQRVRSTAWVAPTMVALLVVGLTWVVVYYVTEAQWPIEALGNANLLVGLGLIAAGCAVATRWK